MKIFLAQGWVAYTNWLPNVEIVQTIEEADVVMFEGGTDVDPALYGETRGIHTDRSDVARDLREHEMFRTAVRLGKKIIGICRGSQLCCALSGGKLVQHQPNPEFLHDIKTSTGEVIPITSTHHQAQFPFEMKEGEQYELLAWTEGLLPFHLNGKEQEMNPAKEAEIVYYPKTKALAIQGHPEFMKPNEYKETFKYLNTLIERYIK